MHYLIYLHTTKGQRCRPKWPTKDFDDFRDWVTEKRDWDAHGYQYISATGPTLSVSLPATDPPQFLYANHLVRFSACYLFVLYERARQFAGVKKVTGMLIPNNGLVFFLWIISNKVLVAFGVEKHFWEISISLLSNVIFNAGFRGRLFQTCA